jgi:hypothetical protein
MNGLLVFFEMKQKKSKSKISVKKSCSFIRGIIFFCAMDGFSRILGKKAVQTFMHTAVHF